MSMQPEPAFRLPWRMICAAAAFTLLMIGAGVAANILTIHGNGKLSLMVPGLLALGWLMWEALRLARSIPGSAIARYISRVVPLLVANVVTVVAAITIQREWHPTGIWAVLLALLPAPPLIGFIWAMGRLLVEETDEYLRMVHARRALIASGFMLVITTVWGLLEGSGLAPHAPAYAAFILWNLGLLLAPLFPGGRA
ncbi:hypothetical protein J3E64_002834 [Sphingobium sp. OAS761]|uniref:hypothetical protein n=1 Tax=Sphingobium sp. OAS761 TaxID=2817901 RepID=UPI0020A22049|nr:hypothetical protein [Sphingobium sp. OAS761]MCP1471130.1 hypothetical protein [Sphingobium sp. OAS761]